MSENTTTNNPVRITALRLGMAIGLILGSILGLAFDNLVIFAGGGMILGLSIGLAWEKRRRDLDN
jgi:hypothetical protein